MPLRHTLTSLYGGTGTLEMSGDGTQHTSTVVSIRSSKSSEIVAMLREAIEYLGAGSDTRTDDDLTLRLVQQQRDQATERAEKAEKERDEARAAMSELAPAEVCVRGDWFKPSELPEVLGRVMDARDEAQREAKRYYLLTAESRPLTPTDEMVKRARVAWLGANINLTPDGFIREILTAALTKPQRPEGAEDVAVRLFQAGAAVGVEMTAEQRDALADHLAAMHVRVVGEEQP